MKFEKNATIKGAFIPRSALALSGFVEDETAALHTLPGAIVLLKKRMTAMDLLNAMDSLSKLSTHLTTELFKLCGPCDDCQDEGCPYEDVDGPIDLPDYLREEAGISKDANRNEKAHDVPDAPVPDGGVGRSRQRLGVYHRRPRRPGVRQAHLGGAGDHR